MTKNSVSMPVMPSETNGIGHDFFASALEVKCVSDFKEWTRGTVRRLLPHGALACGLGRIHAAGVALDYIITVDYPIGHLESIRNKAGGIDTPILRRWLLTREPQLFESDAPWPDCPPEWLANFRKHELVNTAAHATYDMARCIGTYFSFHRVPGRLDESHRAALQQVVPVMHDVMHRVIIALDKGDNFGTRLALLTRREKELLEWLRMGKSNGEIALIACLSETTVKHHVTHILAKLGVENRVHLVRQMAEESARFTPEYGTKVL